MKRFIAFILLAFTLGTLSLLAVPIVFADTVIFEDAFTDSNGTILSSHTPNTGTSWTQVIDVGGADLEIDSNQLGGGSCGLNDGVAYTADVTYSSADYYAEVTMVTGDTGDDWNYIGIRVEPDGDGYYFRFNETNNSGGFEASFGGIMEKSGVSAVQISSNYSTAIANGSVVKIQAVGSTITVYDDGVQILSVTDGTYSAAGKAAVGMGTLTSEGYDCSSQLLDNFKVTMIGSAAVADQSYGVIF